MLDPEDTETCELKVTEVCEQDSRSPAVDGFRMWKEVKLLLGWCVSF